MKLNAWPESSASAQSKSCHITHQSLCCLSAAHSLLLLVLIKLAVEEIAKILARESKSDSKEPVRRGYRGSSSTGRRVQRQ